MYVLFFIAILLVVLYVFKQQVETFTNIGVNTPTVQKVNKNNTNNKNNKNNKNNNNKNNNNKHNTNNKNKNTPKVNEYGDEIYQCEGGPYKFNNSSYISKYDCTRCVPCKNPPKCNEHTMKCIDENTFYNTLDNCVEDGTCRLVEDEINMSPIRTTCAEKQ